MAFRRAAVRQPPSPAAMFGGLMYQIALSLAAFVGVAAYTSGLGLEACLLRVVMALLASTIACYLANACLLVSQIGRAPTEVVLHLPPATRCAAPERAIEAQTRSVLKPEREIELEARRVDAPAQAAPADSQAHPAAHSEGESAG